jgi:hypothetical protein
LPLLASIKHSQAFYVRLGMARLQTAWQEESRSYEHQEVRGPPRRPDNQARITSIMQETAPGSGKDSQVMQRRWQGGIP